MVGRVGNNTVCLASRAIFYTCAFALSTNFRRWQHRDKIMVMVMMEMIEDRYRGEKARRNKEVMGLRH